MCLEIKSQVLPKSLIKKNGRVTVYKMLEYSSLYQKFVTPYRREPINGCGWFEARLDACLQADIKHTQKVNGGAIHGYFEDIIYMPNGCILIKCEAYPKDFIALGKHKDICFKKIFISKTAILNAVKAIKIHYDKDIMLMVAKKLEYKK